MLVCFLSLSFVFFCFLLFSSFRPLSSLFNLLGISGPQVFHIPLSCLSHHHRHSISSRSPNLLNPSGFPVPSSPRISCPSSPSGFPAHQALSFRSTASLNFISSLRLSISSSASQLLGCLSNPLGLFNPLKSPRISCPSISPRGLQSSSTPLDFRLLRPLVPFVPNPLSPPSKETYLCKCTPLAKFTT